MPIGIGKRLATHVHMPISDFCSGEIVTIHAEASVRAAAEVMRQNRVGCLAVLEGDAAGQRPIGMVTDRDIVLKAVAENQALETTSVRAIMSPDPITIDKDAGVFDAIKLMEANSVRRLIVTDAAGEAVSFLSADDFVRILGDEISRIGDLFLRQARLEEPRPEITEQEYVI